MPLFLASLPVSAAVCPHLPVDLVSRRASVHDINEGTSCADLLVTVSYLNQVATTVLPFMIIDGDAIVAIDQRRSHRMSFSSICETFADFGLFNYVYRNCRFLNHTFLW